MDSAYFIRFSLTEPTKGKDNTQIENTTMHRITAIQESLFSIYAQKIVDLVTICTIGIGLEQHLCTCATSIRCKIGTIDAIYTQISP